MYSLEVAVERSNGAEFTTSLVMDGCVAAGYTGRDQDSVHQHIEELKTLGVATPYRIPALYWISPHRLTQQNQIHVIGEQTSPEVEFFLATDRDGSLYVTVASDHTDRTLETVSVSKSKQICDKAIGGTFWAVADIAGHWDQIEITSSIYHQGQWVEYQAGTLKNILHYTELLELITKDSPGTAAPGLLSGTLPIVGGEMVYGARCTIRMNDPVLKRSIKKTYDIIVLPDRS